MNQSPQVEFRPQSAVLISIIVVVNIMWWMVMIAAIGLGTTHLSRCPVQPYIPIYLLVLGVSNFLSLSLTYTKSSWKEGCVYTLISVCMYILYLFTFFWLIAASSWVYSVYPPNYSPGADRYCDKTTYQFAFVVTTLLWVIITLMFVCGGLVTGCKTESATQPLLLNHNTFYGGTNDFPEPTTCYA